MLRSRLLVLLVIGVAGPALLPASTRGPATAAAADGQPRGYLQVRSLRDGHLRWKYVSKRPFSCVAFVGGDSRRIFVSRHRMNGERPDLVAFDRRSGGIAWRQRAVSYAPPVPQALLPNSSYEPAPASDASLILTDLHQTIARNPRTGKVRWRRAYSPFNILSIGPSVVVFGPLERRARGPDGLEVVDRRSGRTRWTEPVPAGETVHAAAGTRIVAVARLSGADPLVAPSWTDEQDLRSITAHEVRDGTIRWSAGPFGRQLLYGVRVAVAGGRVITPTGATLVGLDTASGTKAWERAGVIIGQVSRREGRVMTFDSAGSRFGPVLDAGTGRDLFPVRPVATGGRMFVASEEAVVVREGTLAAYRMPGGERRWRVTAGFPSGLVPEDHAAGFGQLASVDGCSEGS